jgi:hypothetical protein
MQTWKCTHFFGNTKMVLSSAALVCLFADPCCEISSGKGLQPASCSMNVMYSCLTVIIELQTLVYSSNSSRPSGRDYMGTTTSLYVYQCVCRCLSTTNVIFCVQFAVSSAIGALCAAIGGEHANPLNSHACLVTRLQGCQCHLNRRSARIREIGRCTVRTCHHVI